MLGVPDGRVAIEWYEKALVHLGTPEAGML
jgi:hypothetical protein